MSKLTYIRCGDYDIPNLKLSEQPETSIGKYGRMRKSYLKEHRPILYNQLLMSEELYPHLLEIDWTAQERVDTMLPHMMEAAGVTEELKACDPMRWVGFLSVHFRFFLRLDFVLIPFLCAAGFPLQIILMKPVLAFFFFLQFFLFLRG